MHLAYDLQPPPPPQKHLLSSFKSRKDYSNSSQESFTVWLFQTSVHQKKKAGLGCWEKKNKAAENLFFVFVFFSCTHFFFFSTARTDPATPGTARPPKMKETKGKEERERKKKKDCASSLRAFGPRWGEYSLHGIFHENLILAQAESRVFLYLLGFQR